METGHIPAEVIRRTGFFTNIHDLVQRLRGKEREYGKTHRKLKESGTTPVRFGRDYIPGGEAEFQALKKMWDIDQTHFIQPYELVIQNGSVIGYDMELVNGQDLLQYYLEHKLIPQRFADQITDAMGQIHRAGIAHGDIKATNIMVDCNGVVKIGDPVGYGDEIVDQMEQAIVYDEEVLKKWLPLATEGKWDV